MGGLNAVENHDMQPLITYTAPDLAHAAVYPSALGYVVRFGYLTGPLDDTGARLFCPSIEKPARSYVKEGSAKSAARAWVE